jgi:hypothetical protein
LLLLFTSPVTGAVLQVIDNVDQRLRGMIATAKVYDQKKNELDFTMPMATIMAIHSHVAEGAAASAAEGLATALAQGSTLYGPGNTPLELSEVLKLLKEVCMPNSCNSCACLAAAVEGVLDNYMAASTHQYAVERRCSACALSRQIHLCDSSAVCLQEFSGAALNVKFSTTGITQLKVFNGLLSSGE